MRKNYLFASILFCVFILSCDICIAYVIFKYIVPIMIQIACTLMLLTGSIGIAKASFNPRFWD